MRRFFNPGQLFSHLELFGRGDSDAGLALVPREVADFARRGARVAFVRRGLGEVVESMRQSFAQEGMNYTDGFHDQVLKAMHGIDWLIEELPESPVVAYEDLDDEAQIRSMHAHLMPNETFDERWYEMLVELRVTQIHRKAAESLASRGQMIGKAN
jgi:hypothetical protein